MGVGTVADPIDASVRQTFGAIAAIATPRGLSDDAGIASVIPLTIGDRGAAGKHS